MKTLREILGGTALVDYDQASADAAFAALRTLPELKGPGLSQADAVQVVTQLAGLRNSVCPYSIYAIYEQDGTFSGVREVWDAEDEAIIKKAADAGKRVVNITGSGPLYSAMPGGEGLPDDWGPELALALDQCIQIIADAEKGPNIPVGFRDIAKQVAVPLPIVAVIVTGVAVAVITSVATWRYLDPKARAAITQVREASRHFSQRLEHKRQTGETIPPSDVEKAAAAVVKELSDERSGHEWLWGAGIAGGVLGVTLLAAWLGRQAA